MPTPGKEETEIGDSGQEFPTSVLATGNLGAYHAHPWTWGDDERTGLALDRSFPHGVRWSNHTYVALALLSLLATCVVF